MLSLVTAAHAFFGLALLRSSTIIAADWNTAVHPGRAASPAADQDLGAGLAWAFAGLPAVVTVVMLLSGKRSRDPGTSRRDVPTNAVQTPTTERTPCDTS